MKPSFHSTARVLCTKTAARVGLGALLLLSSSQAHARRGGIASPGCFGCHSGGAEPDVELSFEPAQWQPGESVIATVRVEALNGNTGGFYLMADSGVFSTINGEGTAAISDREVVHSGTKAASGGALSYRVQWVASPEPAGVLFEVFALSANGNGSTSGDGAGETRYNAVAGCEGELYTVDFDADGYGQEGGLSLLDCGPRPGFAAEIGDCDDFNATTFPGAPELCNNRDDNCDGVADEGLNSGTTTLYADADGDGHGAFLGETVEVEGCDAPVGFAKVNDDCDDGDATAHPGATESCNLRDDNCDGHADEALRPECGVGMCLRRSSTCDAASCTPGVPSAEICNFADDDCDGDVDEDPGMCPGDQVCYFGRCLAQEDLPEDFLAPVSSVDSMTSDPSEPSLESMSGAETVSDASVSEGEAAADAAPDASTSSDSSGSSSANPSAAAEPGAQGGDAATQGEAATESSSSSNSSADVPADSSSADARAENNGGCAVGQRASALGSPVSWWLLLACFLGLRRQRGVQ